MKHKEYSLIFLVQFLYSGLVVFSDLCGFHISNHFLAAHWDIMTDIVYSFFFMCVGYTTYLSLEYSQDPHLSLLLRSSLFYIVCLLFRADSVFLYAITYMLICGFCFYSDIMHILVLGLAFCFGFAGIITDSIILFGFLFTYLGMAFCKHRKALHHIPLGNFAIPAFTVILLDNLFRYYILEKPGSSLSITTIGITILLFLITTSVPVYGTGRRIRILNIASAATFFVYGYENRLLSSLFGPVLTSASIIFINIILAWGLCTAFQKIESKIRRIVTNLEFLQNK